MIRFASGTFNLDYLAAGVGPFGGRFIMTPGGDKVVRTGSLTINGHLDIADNHVILDYTGITSPIADIRAAAARGIFFNSAGPGLYSSLTPTNPGSGIGYAEASALFTTFPATFAGQTVDATTVIITYTRYGDANLDDVVNLADFNRLAAHFGGSNKFWAQGDFNYDGLVNLADFNLLAANFGLITSGPEVTPGDWSALASAVPEPAATVWILTAPGALLPRRARRARL